MEIFTKAQPIETTMTNNRPIVATAVVNGHRNDEEEGYPGSDGSDPTKKQGNASPPANPWKRRAIIIAVTAVIMLAIGIGIGVTVGGGDDKSKSSASATDGKDNNSDEDNDQKQDDFEVPDGPAPFTSVGCFREEASLDFLELDGRITDQAKPWKCSQYCLTRFYGVTSDQCKCFVDVPQNRLAIGSCDAVSDEDSDGIASMELYFNQESNLSCSQDRTATVRNFLVEEDDAPFGFDIVDNTFRNSPFEQFKDDCGTNIYKVQTEVSEGSNSLQTTVMGVTEFAQERRNARQASLEASASFEKKGRLFSAALQVSASMDKEVNSLFKSSGASETESKVMISTGVKRLAEVKILDFDNTRNFVTLSSTFGNLLRTYLKSDFEVTVAHEIIEKYGQFVLTRGIFGGYMELRNTMNGSVLASSFETREQARQCYEASVSAEASSFGFKGSASASAAGCTSEALEALRKSRRTFQQEVSEQTVVGGRKACSTCEEFTVGAEDSTLLTTKDKYPDNSGVRFRLLTDFLSPDKISPLEVRRLQITESEFEQIHENLEDAILDYLDDLSGIIGSCNCTGHGTTYLEEDDKGNRVCACYTPMVADRTVIVDLADGSDTFSKRGNRRPCAWDSCPSAKFQWNNGNDCDCVGGLNQCYVEGDPTTVQRFTKVELTPLEDNPNVFRMEAAGDETSLQLGSGGDTASGKDCFDDPLRGGFQIDLTGIPYKFAENSKVTIKGWSPKMRVMTDNKADPLFARKPAASATLDVLVPPGAKKLTVNCGGWGASCSSELFVEETG